MFLFGNFQTLHWRHNDHDGVSNHQPHNCLLNRLFICRSKKTSKLRVTGLCVGNSPGPVNSPHKGPVTRKIFPFDDVIMNTNVFLQIRHVLLQKPKCPFKVKLMNEWIFREPQYISCYCSPDVIGWLDIHFINSFLPSAAYMSVNRVSIASDICHYLNQCSLIVNLTPRKFQWNLHRNSIIFIQENAFETVSLPKWWPFCPGGDELRVLEDWRKRRTCSMKQQLHFFLH